MPSRGELGTRRLDRAVLERRARRWSGAAWGALAVTAGFIAITAWWLTQDSSVPFGGESQHLYGSLTYYEAFKSGDILRAFEGQTYYPPLVRTFGALALTIGGMRVGGPVFAQNLVFVPLLALACYRVGRMIAGPRAGLLAVVFALGTPLIVEQFHNFMLDAPETALVAVSVWLILASDRFARADLAALAGLTVGLGLLTKQLMPLFLAGLVPAVLARGGGWRNWRGVLAFAGVALLVAAPWYLHHHGDWSRWFEAGGTGTEGEPVPPKAAPPLISLANLGWYFWATLNALLFAALFAFAAIGTFIAARRAIRERPRPAGDFLPELLWGLAGAWLALSFLRHHDDRYTMPLIVYLSVLGTAWIVRLRPTRQAIATGLLVVAVIAAHLGATFGAGRGRDQLPLSNGAIHEGEGVPPRDRVVFYSSLDYLLSSPQRNGDLLNVMHALKRHGVQRVDWRDHADINDHLFESIGLTIFAHMAGMKTKQFDEPSQEPEVTAILTRDPAARSIRPCRRMANATGVRITIRAPGAASRAYCP
jgi:4-amino-4-deoxy-L-arabinose transferase-like glycosyltransferase